MQQYHRYVFFFIYKHILCIPINSFDIAWLVELKLIEKQWYTDVKSLLTWILLYNNFFFKESNQPK